MQSTGIYEVANPVAQPSAENIPSAEPLSGMEGKKIGFMWTIYTNGDILAEMLMELLSNEFKDLETVKLPAGKRQRWGEYPDKSLDSVVKETGVDAVVVTIGC